MLRRPPRSTRTDTLFPTRRSSDLVTPLSARAIVKPTLIVILLIASVCSYFMSTFGVVIDKAMIANALQTRSEEHTSELQSLMRISYAVFCLKKKKSLEHTTPLNEYTLIVQTIRRQSSRVST